MNKEKNESLEWLKIVSVTALFIIAIRIWIFTPVIVDGASMMPTYENGDRVIINKLEKITNDIERFEIVVFKVTEDTNYIKRVIGLPGDSVFYTNDELYINGKKYDEPYLDAYKAQLKDSGKLTYNFTLEEITGFKKIPQDYYLVLGDNRRKSSDSRDPKVGLVAKKQIIGTAKVRISPLKTIGLVK